MLHSRVALRLASLAVLLICAALMVAPFQAQDDVPAVQTETGPIYFWSSEVIFPEAVRFTIVVNRMARDLAFAVLSIEPDGQEPVEIPVSIVESAVFVDPFTELHYFWEIPDDMQVPLFSQVTYRWRVVSNQDEVLQLEDNFQFTDSRIQWIQDDDPEGVLNLTVPVDGVNPAALRESVRPIYALMAENVSRQPQLNLIVYPSNIRVDACVRSASGRLVVVSPGDGVEIACSRQTATEIFQASGLDVLQLPPARGGISDQAALTDALVERFYGPVWDGKGVPDWFRFGLVQFYLPEFKSELLPLLQVAVRNDRLFNLDEMAVMPALTEADLTELERWRAQSYGMLVYTADQVGVPALFRLANGVGAAPSFAEAYQDAVGFPPTGLLPLLKNWVFKDAAFAAFGFTPYQPDTPTPPPTRTPTPFPPTPSYTPTSTSTHTPTPTVTGFLSATPLPSRTPEPTRKPPTPSLTPRPAGSLIDTPTPVPNPSAASQVDPRVSLAVVGVVFLILVVLTMIYLRLLGRQRRR